MHLTLLPIFSFGNKWFNSHPSSHMTSYFVRMFIQCSDFLLNYISFRITCFLYTFIYKLAIISTFSKVLKFCFGRSKGNILSITFLFVLVYSLWCMVDFLMTLIQSLSHFLSILNLLRIYIFWLSTITLSGLLTFYVLNKLAIVD